MRILGAAVILFAMAGFAQATGVVSPEIDGNSLAAGIALISGGILVVRGRRKR